MLKNWQLSILAAGLIAQSPAAFAADFSDPTWPCIQRKVETLSPALMWPYPLSDDPVPIRLKKAVNDLAGALALRRIEIETLRSEVEAFVDEHGGDPQLLGHVFEGSFENLNKRRGRIIRGIGKFSLSQIALSEQIDQRRVAFDEALAADEPDYDLIDKLEEKLDWDQVIFTDRSQSITYLCETPQLIERRLFAIAQMLASVAEDPS